MANKKRLPRGFAKLECLVDEWVLPNSQARSEKRFSTSPEELRTFYNTMLEHAEKALASLQKCQLGELSSEQETLLKLMLSLAEVGPAVEWYGEVQATDSFDSRRFPLSVQMSDSAAQVRAS
ncbi:MAG: hypothetical protein O3C28_17170 [Proteobacteria bacterium]|nr:hypothetical protein [Pseudomonadota bacterium]